MTGVLLLAWRYLLWHRFKTAILVLAITLVIYLPLALQLVITQTAADMTARADRSPLLAGSRGSPSVRLDGRVNGRRKYMAVKCMG